MWIYNVVVIDAKKVPVSLNFENSVVYPQVFLEKTENAGERLPPTHPKVSVRPEEMAHITVEEDVSSPLVANQDIKSSCWRLSDENAPRSFTVQALATRLPMLLKSETF